MNVHSFALLVIATFLVSLWVHMGCLSLFVDRRWSLNAHFAVALLGASVFIFGGHLLGGPVPDSAVVTAHRIRSLGMLICLVGYQYTLCGLYAPSSRIPAIFLACSLLLVTLLPFSAFLREPVQHLPARLGSLDLHFRLATPGLAYRIYSVLVVGFFTATLVQVVRGRTALSRIYGLVGIVPVLLGGANDFLVAQRIIRGPLVSEYLIFLFITPIYVYLLREEQKKQRRLEQLNRSLEAEVQARTRQLAEANRSLEAERDSLQQSLLQIRTLHGLLPICASCKNIRDDQGYWSQVEEYFQGHADVEFTHSYCPRCARSLYPEMYDEAR